MPSRLWAALDGHGAGMPQPVGESCQTCLYAGRGSTRDCLLKQSKAKGQGRGAAPGNERNTSSSQQVRRRSIGNAVISRSTRKTASAGQKKTWLCDCSMHLTILYLTCLQGKIVASKSIWSQKGTVHPKFNTFISYSPSLFQIYFLLCDAKYDIERKCQCHSCVCTVCVYLDISVISRY